MLMDDLLISTFGTDTTTIDKVKIEITRRMQSGEITEIDLLEKPDSILRNIIGDILPTEANGTVGTLVIDGDVYEGDGSRYVKTSTNSGTGSGVGGEFIQGPSGPQGEQGYTGYTGSKGDIGYTGSMGYTGSTGARGLTGYDGSVGNTGPIGPTGLQGPVGPIGYTGSKGASGYTGSQGIQGVIGYTGSQGYTGSMGIQGPIGMQGGQGPIGYTGSQGEQGVLGAIGPKGYTGSIGYTGSQGPIGPQGIQGIQGPIGYTGSVGPAGTVGNAATATLATKASTLAMGGGNGTASTWNWSGQGGQPTWVWGGSDGSNMYVWNPANFNVNNAVTAGTASNAYWHKMDGLANAGSCAALMSTTPPYSASVREVNGMGDAPNTGWWFIHSIRHSNSSNLWGTQIAYGWESNANTIYQRNVSGGGWSGWVVVNNDNVVSNVVGGQAATRTEAGSRGGGNLASYQIIGYEVFKPYSKAIQLRAIQQLTYYNCDCNCNCSD